MLRLDETVSARVVARDADVADTVARGDEVESCDVDGAVVSDQLCESAPHWGKGALIQQIHCDFIVIS